MQTLKVTLKQHTPLIHFQHDQDDATLRASEVKPKLDRYIIENVFDNDYDSCKEFLVGYDFKKPDKLKDKFASGYKALDYKMRVEDDLQDNILYMNTNEKRLYSKCDRQKDEKKNRNIRYVNYGDIITESNRNDRFVINDGKKQYFGKLRKSDCKIIYDLDSYPCYFANMDCDIKNPEEYKKITFAQEPFSLFLTTKHQSLLQKINDAELLSSFFLNHNFGTRQSKGFGSFYVDENDDLYMEPSSQYHFNIQVNEEYYSDEFRNLFKAIELFTKTLRAGINEKRGKDTVFYFKSLAFKYCKEVLSAEWDKKRVKSLFYFDKDKNKRRFDSLSEQQNNYYDDEDHDVLFFDADDGYDMRDLLGFSTNEEWQSYKDSIEKKVAISENGLTRFPRRDEVLPVDRMRSPLLIKPICSVDDEGNVSYDIYLLFQDAEVGMNGLKRQQEICFYSKKERDENGRPKRFRLKLPQDFSTSDFFDFIFNKNKLNFDISSHVEEKYQEHDYYEILDDIYTQIKENLQ